MPFKGINNLRDHNESVPIERWQLDELRKCANDPLYFITHYVMINTKDRGMQLFKMWDFQKELVQKYINNRFVIAKWPRQSGKCVHSDEKIYIKNKDGEEMEFTIGEFFNLLDEENKNE